MGCSKNTFPKNNYNSINNNLLAIAAGNNRHNVAAAPN